MKKELFVKNYSEGVAKNENPYLKISCVDSDKEEYTLWAWDFEDAIFKDLDSYSVFQIEADFNAEYIKPKSYKPLPDADISLYVDSYLQSREERRDLLWSLIDDFKLQNYKEFCTDVFKPIEDDFIEYPAAMNNHHIEIGGLLRHTQEVIKFLKKFCTIDDIAQVGALIHDIGKLFEYNLENYRFTRSEKSTVFSHLSCPYLITEIKTSDFLVEEGEKDHLIHIVHSHHGIKEWGAIEEPKSLEAIAVFLGDYWSCKSDAYNLADFDGKVGKISGRSDFYLFEGGD